MKTSLPLLFIGTVLFSNSLYAQDFPPFPKPSKEHEFLKKFVGIWEVKNSSKTGEDKPEMQGVSVMKSKMLGGYWIINESEHTFGKIKVQSLQVIGFDSKKKKYVGSWNDSVSDYMWQYEGEVNKERTKLTLNATGPDVNDPTKMAEYQDAFEFIDENTIKATSAMKGKDGKWTVFNAGIAKRRKK